MDDVLAGRTSLRQAATSEVFSRGILAQVEEGARQYRELSEDERAPLAEQGEREFARLRGESGTPNEDDDVHQGVYRKKP
ncbi:hypothetical protein [Actinokineospora enzanensis]|uniref:hypothetical protein n=1 Tax=Actinokineospora enzanensis TaxID=155975 RepID=UPI0012EBBA68|nr:hypothetical protein [Actinokineospora enzanensis]